MMSPRELALGMVGAWRLLRNDASGVQYFEGSLDAARRSFWVMLLLVPVDAVQSLMHLGMLGVERAGTRELVLLALAYLIGWLYFPVIVLRVATATGKLREFPGYLAAFNYAQILVYGLSVGAIALASILPSALRPLVGLAMLVLFALLHFRLLRHMMGFAPPQAGMLVFANISLDIALSLTLPWLLLYGTQAA